MRNLLINKEVCVYPLSPATPEPLLAGKVIEVSEYGIAVQRYLLQNNEPGKVGTTVTRRDNVGISFLTWGALQNYELKTFDALLFTIVGRSSSEGCTSEK